MNLTARSAVYLLSNTLEKMKQKKFKFKLFGWYIYFSRMRLKTFHPQLKVVSQNCLKNFMSHVKNFRYESNGGCCEACGEHMGMDQIQMHHILPYNEFPAFARKEWNLLMLCHRCHYMIHHNPVWSVELMEQVACKQGIDLQREFRLATAQRWQEREKARMSEQNKMS